MANKQDQGAEIVEIRATDGVPFIEQASPLTRLHYFDGQYLRATAFELEQAYHRYATSLANLAGGWGVVHGLGVRLANDELEVGAGLGITAAGHFVRTGSAVSAAIAKLLKTAAAPPPEGNAAFKDCLQAKKAGVKETAGLAIYEITVGPIEGLCGNEPVYGKLCDTACASDSSRPYFREGLVLRLRPVSLSLPASKSVPASNVHLRNRIASAYFAAEPWLVPSAVSASGLASAIWCEPATLYGRDEIVIGLLAREAGVVRVIDAWSGRRERMDTQARGYWQGRMSMRPWNVFVAQILQFQCQLSGLFDATNPVILPSDDCDEVRNVLAKTRKGLERLLAHYGKSAKKILSRVEGRPSIEEYANVATEIDASFAELDGLSGELASAERGKGALPGKRMLLAAGFFELPPAGYLPIVPSSDVPEQLARLFGEGVRLRYHAVQSDEIAHFVEEAQHLRRISLTRGLDDAADIEPVEIFVPDGEVEDARAPSAGTWWEVEMPRAGAQLLATLARAKQEGDQRDIPDGAAVPAAEVAGPALETNDALTFDGLARTEARDDGTYGLTLVVASDPVRAAGKYAQVRLQRDVAAVRRASLLLAADLAKDPFDLPVGGEMSVRYEIAIMSGNRAERARVDATLTVIARRTLDSGEQALRAQLDGALANATPVPLIIERRGDAKTAGTLSLRFAVVREGADFNVEWDVLPRRAGVFIAVPQDVKLADAVASRMSAFGVRAAAATPSPAPAPPGTPAPPGAPPAEPGTPAETTPAQTRGRLLGMNELAGMPESASAIGTAALNALAIVADAVGDVALLARARQRLFPTIEAPATRRVRAKRDWVMFRRARTPLCGPECPAVAVALEAFQVWYGKTNQKDLPRLARALESRNEAELARFRFVRVGLVRYRDESSFSEESPERLVAMWTALDASGKVALGRVWETAPVTGQGWQNHARLRNLLDQSSPPLQPPARGDSSLAAIQPPPGALDDRAFDGGMLVVTLDSVTRRALLVYVSVDNGLHYPLGNFPSEAVTFKDDVPEDPPLKAFVERIRDQPLGGGTLATTKAEPDATAAVRLNAALIVHPKGAAVRDDRRIVALLVPDDRQQLEREGIIVDDFDEIIFFELQE
jgi:hypothetical protein